jgi:hypothetical protein
MKLTKWKGNGCAAIRTVPDGSTRYSLLKKYKAPEVLTTPGASFLGSGGALRHSLHTSRAVEAAGGRTGGGAGGIVMVASPTGLEPARQKT